MKYFWDRVKETTSSSGTNDHTLTGAVSNFRSFSDAAVPNGTIVLVLAVAGTQWEVSEGAYNSGTGVVARTRILSSSTGSKITFSASPTVAIVYPAEQINYGMAYRRDFIAGLTIANDTTDANNDLVIQPGICRDRTDLEDMELTSQLIKQLDASWAVGNNAGGRLEGSGKLASQMYAIWALKRTDTAVVDIGISTALRVVSATVTMTIASPGVITWTGHGFTGGEPIVFSTTGALPTGLTAGTVYFVLSASLTADTFRVATTQGGTAINTSGSQSGTHTGTSTPTLPSNYTIARRIGFIRTDGSSNILPFVQDPAYPDLFRMKAMLSDFSNTSYSVSTRQLVTSLGPPNCVLLLNVREKMNPTGSFYVNYTWVRPVESTDVTPTETECNSIGHENQPSVTMVLLKTNSARQYAFRRSAGSSGELGSLRLGVEGWYDNRRAA